MFGAVKNLINYGKTIFERCLTEADVNSRLVFLGTAIVTCILMLGHFLVYAIGMLHGKPMDPSYPTVLGVLLGGHGVNGLSRYFTKKNGGDGGNGNGSAPDPNPPPPDPSAALTSPPQGQ